MNTALTISTTYKVFPRVIERLVVHYSIDNTTILKDEQRGYAFIGEDGSKCIEMPDVSNGGILEMYISLHEFGHHHFDHLNRIEDFEDDVEAEFEATIFGLRIVRKLMQKLSIPKHEYKKALYYAEDYMCYVVAKSIGNNDDGIVPESVWKFIEHRFFDFLKEEVLN